MWSVNKCEVWFQCTSMSLLRISPLPGLTPPLPHPGKLWAHEMYGVTPDIMTLAKPLAGGLPIGAALMKQHVADVMKPGGEGREEGRAMLEGGEGREGGLCFLAESRGPANRQRPGDVP